jgi:hypothetical protein
VSHFLVHAPELAVAVQSANPALIQRDSNAQERDAQMGLHRFVYKIDAKNNTGI